MNREHHPNLQPEKKNPRRRSIPWWIYLASALVCYPLLNYVLPAITEGTEGMIFSADMLKSAAPILTLALLLLAANGLYENTGEEEKEPTEE